MNNNTDNNTNNNGNVDSMNGGNNNDRPNKPYTVRDIVHQADPKRGIHPMNPSTLGIAYQNEIEQGYIDPKKVSPQQFLNKIPDSWEDHIGDHSRHVAKKDTVIDPQTILKNEFPKYYMIGNYKVAIRVGFNEYQLDVEEKEVYYDEKNCPAMKEFWAYYDDLKQRNYLDSLHASIPVKVLMDKPDACCAFILNKHGGTKYSCCGLCGCSAGSEVDKKEFVAAHRHCQQGRKLQLFPGGYYLLNSGVKKKFCWV